MSGEAADKVTVWIGGQRVLVPATQLEREEDGSYRLPLPLEELLRLAREGTEAGGPALVVPVIDEQLVVDKRERETGRVRVVKTVREREQLVDLPLLEEDIEVERRPINRVVAAPVAVRREGDDLIIPLLEEVLVVEKRLILKEEIHVRKRSQVVHRPQRVVLRSEEARIERLDGEEGQAGDAPSRKEESHDEDSGRSVR